MEELTPLLQVERVTKIFKSRRRGGAQDGKGVTAVRDVSLSIHAGEFLGIVGESGSGKSTLGRIIVGLTSPSAGAVRWNGPLRAGSRQMVFQDPRSSLDPRMRVGKCIGEGVPRCSRGRAERHEDIKRALTEVGLAPEHADVFPHELSGGQAQRVCVARAIIGAPELVVLDEVVSALDISTSVEILKMLARLNRETGITFVFISHDLKAVSQVCTRVAVMSRGKIVEIVNETRGRAVAWVHPYSRVLYSADVVRLRRSDVIVRPLQVVEEEEEDHHTLGCDVVNTCTVAKRICREAEPDFKVNATGGGVLCHYPDELATEAAVTFRGGVRGDPAQ